MWRCVRQNTNPAEAGRKLGGNAPNGALELDRDELLPPSQYVPLIDTLDRQHRRSFELYCPERKRRCIVKETQEHTRLLGFDAGDWLVLAAGIALAALVAGMAGL
jgi:hypothetical protein